MELIAFYGSLMRGEGAQEELGTSGGLEWIGACEIPGELYDLGGYPGLVLAGTGRVAGELYRLTEAQVLGPLDAYEEFQPEDPTGSLFLRQRVMLRLPAVESWVYVYAGSTESAHLIPGGCWRTHRRAVQALEQG